MGKNMRDLTSQIVVPAIRNGGILLFIFGLNDVYAQFRAEPLNDA
jgi:hypothetical protein